MSNENGISARIAKIEICNVCKNPADLRCSGCKIVYYCNRQHQKIDWKSHSKKCQAYELAENAIVGRHYVATRDINVDENIFSEIKPLLVAMNVGSSPVCLSCHAPLTPRGFKTCRKCGWSLCRHCTIHGPECELTIKYRTSKVNMDTYDFPTSIYNAIMVLRAIHLRDNNPRDYHKLMKLQDYCDDISNIGDNLLSINHLSAHNVKTYMKIHDLDLTEISRIMGIMRVNAFKSLTAQGHHRSAVFDKVSFMAHDCYPNCTWYSYNDANNEARMVVRVVRKITKGEPITITYTSCMQNTVQRRRILKEGKSFDCMCERCKDPTDFGTMCSAIKCFQKECTGYMLPPTFLVSYNEKVPDFVCNKCKSTVPSVITDGIVQDISRKYSEIDESNGNQLKKFINEQSKILHNNHLLIIEAELKFITETNLRDGGASASINSLKDNIKICRKLKALLEVLEPASPAPRAMILLSQFKYTNLLMEKQRLQPRQFQQLLKESKTLLTEAVRLTQYFPKESTESKIAMLARMQLDQGNDGIFHAD